MTTSDELIEPRRKRPSAIRGLLLDDFKGFKHAELATPRFTVVVGTNAAGKSNLRDAFRFVHGIARGYTLAQWRRAFGRHGSDDTQRAGAAVRTAMVSAQQERDGRKKTPGEQLTS